MEEKFGDLIKRLRLEKGYTIVEFSKVSGFTKAQIHNIEKGSNKPRVFNLNKLAEALGCSYEFLYSKYNEK